MANIQTELNNIKNAMYGKDVRNSIHDGIEAINKEVESTTGRQIDLDSTFNQLIINAGNSNAEIVDARVKNDGTSYSKLGDRLDAVDSQLAHITKEVEKTIHLISNNNLTTDDINDVINKLDAGGIIKLTGEFNSVDFGINLKSNITLEGIGYATIKGNNWLCNTNILTEKPVMYENIKINNITFKHLDGIFEENIGQVLLANVDNVLIENCKFIGSKSDAISVGGGLSYGVISHNYNVTIRDCLFDGIDNNNRNAITLSDVDNCLVENNIFKNFTRFDMPGAIDMETDSESYWVLKNITINNNKFENIGGNVGNIAFYSGCKQSLLGEPVENIKISNNKIINSKDSSAGIVLWQIADDENIENKITVTNNHIENTFRGIVIRGINNVNISNNHFKSIPNSSLIGYDENTDACRNVIIKNNCFCGIGSENGVCFSIFDVKYLDIKENFFENIGLVDLTFGYVLSFDSNFSTSDYISITDNLVIDNQVTKGIVNWGSGYKTIEDTNVFRNNIYNSELINNFKYKKDYQYYNNDFLYDSSTLPDSFPLGTTTTFFIQNDKNLPTNINAGIIETLKFTNESAYRTTIFQRLYSDISNTPVVYIRKAVWDINNWEKWVKIL